MPPSMAAKKNSPHKEVRRLYEYGWKDFFKDVRDYCRTHTFTEIVAAVWQWGRWYYSEDPYNCAALVISLIALGVSSAGIVIAILSPQ